MFYILPIRYCSQITTQIINNKKHAIMETKLFVIIVTPRKQDIPQIVTKFTIDGKPVFCSGKDALKRARFFDTYESAQLYNLEKVQPIIDTKIFSSFV